MQLSKEDISKRKLKLRLSKIIEIFEFCGLDLRETKSDDIGRLFDELYYEHSFNTLEIITSEFSAFHTLVITYDKIEDTFDVVLYNTWKRSVIYNDSFSINDISFNRGKSKKLLEFIEKDVIPENGLDGIPSIGNTFKTDEFFEKLILNHNLQNLFFAFLCSKEFNINIGEIFCCFDGFYHEYTIYFEHHAIVRFEMIFNESNTKSQNINNTFLMLSDNVAKLSQVLITSVKSCKFSLLLNKSYIDEFKSKTSILEPYKNSKEILSFLIHHGFSI